MYCQCVFYDKKNNILIINLIQKCIIIFSPVCLRIRGEMRTLHHVKELLSFYSAGWLSVRGSALLFLLSLATKIRFIFLIYK
jgi:hypothetical protein